MSKQVKPDQNRQSSKKEQVTEMFDTISEEYDGLNRMISLGLDQKWRARLVGMAAATKPDAIIDIATGTGDLVIALAESTEASRLVGLDISPGMLEVGKQKVQQKSLDDRIEMTVGDSEQLDYDDNTFDVATVSYGVRNFENLETGLSEIFRILKPGGSLLILETSVPTKFPFKQGYNVFSKVVVPAMGKLFSKDKKAYSYLSESAAHFPYGEAFNNILKKTGFINVRDIPQFYGASTIYQANKPS